ncbi:MAG: nickel-responsive transcriptional regulator NikR [bacterium]
MDEQIIRFGVSIEDKLLKEFDSFIGRKGYGSRSEAIRDLIRNYLITEERLLEDRPALGTLTLVYNHHEMRELVERLTDLQHHHHAKIISSLHIHIDKLNCLEIIVLKGKTSEIKRLSDNITSKKGVKHGKLTLTAIK